MDYRLDARFFHAIVAPPGGGAISFFEIGGNGMAWNVEDLPPQLRKRVEEQLEREDAARFVRDHERAETKVNKYRNMKTTRDGIHFDSQKEARRYDVLKLSLDLGEIKDLKLQPDFTLMEAYTLPTGERVRAIRYRADFSYVDCMSGRQVVEDVKSRATKTRDYIMKKKLMQERFGITVKEV